MKVFTAILGLSALFSTAYATSSCFCSAHEPTTDTCCYQFGEGITDGECVIDKEFGEDRLDNFKKCCKDAGTTPECSRED